MFITELNEFYSYVFGDRANIVVDSRGKNEDQIKKIIESKKQKIQEKFSFITSDRILSKEFRITLRQFGNIQLEECLYGNSTDKLENVTTLIPGDESINESFISLNATYGYFKNEENNLHSFQKLFKITALMNRFVLGDKFSEMYYLHAYKLLVQFGLDNQNARNNPFESIENYLELLKADGVQKPFHDVVMGPLPVVSQIPDFDLPSWQAFIKKYGIEGMTVFGQAEEIWDKIHKTPATLDEAREVLASFKYPSAEEYPELAKVCYEYKVSKSIFKKCLKIEKNRKSEDTLPDELINGADADHPGYYLTKLPIDDPRAYILGFITKCCQYITGDSERCVIDGLTRKNNGFYVLLRMKQAAKNKKNLQPKLENGKINYDDFEIVGQAYAWRGKDENIVFDSWENTYTKHDSIAVDLLRLFAKKITSKYPEIFRVTVGRGGKTPVNLLKNKTSHPGEMKEGYEYGDARSQSVIYVDKDKILARLGPSMEKIGFSVSDFSDSVIDGVHSERSLVQIEDLSKKINLTSSENDVCDPANLNKKIEFFYDTVIHPGLLKELVLNNIRFPNIYLNIMDLFNKPKDIITYKEIINLSDKRDHGCVVALHFYLMQVGIRNENISNYYDEYAEFTNYAHVMNCIHFLKKYNLFNKENVEFILSKTKSNLDLWSKEICIKNYIKLLEVGIPISKKIDKAFLEIDGEKLNVIIKELESEKMLTEEHLNALIDIAAPYPTPKRKLYCVLNQLGVYDKTKYDRILSVFTDYMYDMGKFIEPLKKLHLQGGLNKYFQYVPSAKTGEQAILFVKSICLLIDTGVSNLTEGQINVLLTRKQCYSVLESLYQSRFLNQVSFDLLIDAIVNNKNHDYISKMSIFFLSEKKWLEDVDIQAALSPQHANQFGQLVTNCKDFLRNIDFSKAQLIKLITMSGNHLKAISELKNNQLLNQENLFYLLGLDAISDADINLLVNKQVFLRATLPLLGDGRIGNKDAAKNDRFVTAFDRQRLDALDDKTQLEMLESLFEKIKENKADDDTSLYTRKNNAYFLFFMPAREVPLSSTQRKHILFLQESYMAIVNRNINNIDILNIARNSNLINFNLSYYAVKENANTGYKRKIEDIVSNSL